MLLHFSYLGIKSWNYSNANIIMQITYSHIPINSLTMQTCREVLTALSTENSPLRMVERVHELD
jgi:hypothetical protein